MEDSPRGDFRRWLQRTRRQQGLSQAKLAALMGCTANYIWRLEKGERHPSKEFLQLLRYKLPLTTADMPVLEAFLQMMQYRGNGFERERERERINSSLAKIESNRKKYARRGREKQLSLPRRFMPNIATPASASACPPSLPRPGRARRAADNV